MGINQADRNKLASSVRRFIKALGSKNPDVPQSEAVELLPELRKAWNNWLGIGNQSIGRAVYDAHYQALLAAADKRGASETTKIRAAIAPAMNTVYRAVDAIARRWTDATILGANSNRHCQIYSAAGLDSLRHAAAAIAGSSAMPAKRGPKLTTDEAADLALTNEFEAWRADRKLLIKNALGPFAASKGIRPKQVEMARNRTLERQRDASNHSG